MKQQQRLGLIFLLFGFILFMANEFETFWMIQMETVDYIPLILYASLIIVGGFLFVKE